VSTDGVDRGGDVFVGLDLGTSSLKGVAVTPDGEIVARGHAAYRTTRDTAGQAEQDPAAWLAALRDVVRRLTAAAPPPRWRALALSGMLPTLVLTDGEGVPTGPAITWQDARSEPQGDALRVAAARVLGGQDELYRHTGQRIDGRYLLPMFRRLRETDPDRVAGATRLMSAKDYLFWWLTRECLTDPSTASGAGCYDLASGDWMPRIAALAGVQAVDGPDEASADHGEPRLPAILPSAATRPLHARAASHLGLPVGVPVYLGGADSVLAMLALGVTKTGDVAYITGTSTVIAGYCERLSPDPAQRFLVTPLAGARGWGLEMDLVSTGSAVRWLAGVLGLRDGEHRLMHLAASAPVDDSAAPPSFLPFLGVGEQGALWDPSLRGTIIGLDLSHGPAELARALVEGIVLESRRCLEVLESQGSPPAPLRAAGVGASSSYFRQQLADASGREVLFPADTGRPLSALGAALVAARSAETGPVDARAWSGPWERTAPDASRRAYWQRRWESHNRRVAQASDLYRPRA